MIQTGLESYGRADIEAADAEILALALEAAERAGAGRAEGDDRRRPRVRRRASPRSACPIVWRRRVRRGLAQGKPLEAVLNGGGQRRATRNPGVLAALERADHAGAKALVEDLLAIAGIAAVGGRDVGEIADRFLEQAVAARRGRRQRRTAGDPAPLPRAFPAIPTPPRANCAALAADAGLDLGAALDSFDERTGFLAARGLTVARVPLRRRLRARSRLLHRLRLRGGRRRRAGSAAGARSAAATTGWRAAWARRAICPPSARRSGSTGCRWRESRR